MSKAGGEIEIQKIRVYENIVENGQHLSKITLTIGPKAAPKLPNTFTNRNLLKNPSGDIKSTSSPQSEKFFLDIPAVISASHNYNTESTPTSPAPHKQINNLELSFKIT